MRLTSFNLTQHLCKQVTTLFSNWHYIISELKTYCLPHEKTFHYRRGRASEKEVLEARKNMLLIESGASYWHLQTSDHNLLYFCV